MARVITAALDKYFPETDVDRTTIIAEPGRYFAASAYALNTTIMARTATDASRITKNEGVILQQMCGIIIKDAHR